MADSDEEYDRRKGRDKFRRERNDYERRGDDRRRDPRAWEHERSNGRSSWGSNRDRRDPYREYDSHRRDRAYSPQRREMSPPQAKRMRRDTWEEGAGYPPYGYNGPPGGSGGSAGPPPSSNWSGDPDAHHGPGQGREDMLTQPAMMTFKAFLLTLPDNIGDQDAIKKFNEYKEDFRKQQINEFFLAHKEEEWFKTKYHPEECAKRQQEIRKALKRRCEVFMEFMDSGRVYSVGCDIERNEELVKLLDAVVIKLEGGTDFDLTVLDQPEAEEPKVRSRNNSESAVDQSPDEKKKRKKEEEEKKPDEPLKLPITAEQKELMKKAQEFSKQQQAKNGPDGKKTKKKKRNRDKTEYSYESGSDSESESCSDTDSEPVPPGMEDEPPPPGTDVDIPGVSSTDDITSENKSKELLKSMEEKDVDTTQEDEDTSPKPRALHKTCSIFLRNLAPSITKQEVEAMCKRYPGFVRVALQDPQPERRFFRRGWVTFERDVNIKEICWNLNNIRLRDCELGATLNRELKQRVRPVNGITAHKQIIKADIKLAAKIIQNLDSKWKIWEDEDDDDDEKKDDVKEVPFDQIEIKNPVLKNVTDYLIDEGDFEEEELLGQSMNVGESESKTDEIKMERDETMIQALDSMVLYLRIVHSIDFYSCNEYPNEDEMPHRCGIMHARCVPPTTKVTQNEINEWMKNFENKIKTLTEHHENLPDEEVVRLGKKDPEAEVEKFVTANTQELAKDKWLCPMSGKKFKGPEFVRKHIFNKHGEKVDEVRMEVAFFNNYLMDPKRPALPEHPGNKQASNSRNSTGGDQFTTPGGYQAIPPMGFSGRPSMMYGGASSGPASYQSPSFRSREPYRGPYGRSGGYNRGYRSDSNRHRRNQSDPRRVIEYRDLDAPDDSDLF